MGNTIFIFMLCVLAYALGSLPYGKLALYGVHFDKSALKHSYNPSPALLYQKQNLSAFMLCVLGILVGASLSYFVPYLFLHNPIWASAACFCFVVGGIWPISKKFKTQHAPFHYFAGILTLNPVVGFVFAVLYIVLSIFLLRPFTLYIMLLCLAPLIAFVHDLSGLTSFYLLATGALPLWVKRDNVLNLLNKPERKANKKQLLWILPHNK